MERSPSTWKALEALDRIASLERRAMQAAFARE